jgi:hypothetical protein
VRLGALIASVLALLVRFPYAFTYRFNSDEPQHLHVVWGWTRGLLQYRDVFDNHPPLFHLAMAPVLALVGERAEALPLMRLALLPVWLAALALTFVIARKVYSEVVAFAAVAVLAVFPDFFFTSLEFRTDGLWAVAWLAALAVLFSGSLTPRRAFAGGLLLGVAFATSQKTVLLAAALAGAALLAPAAARARVPVRHMLSVGGPWLAGVGAVPLLVVGGFAAAGALGPMVYCTFTYNLVPGVGSWAHPWRLALFPVGVAAGFWAAAVALRPAPVTRERLLRATLFLTVWIYVVAVHTLWPLVTGQDWLPVHPLAAVLLVGGLSSWAAGRRRSPWFHRSLDRLAVPAVGLALAAGLTAVVLRGPLWVDRGAGAVALVRDVLRLTGPEDVVIDAKGETVFRPRAWRLVLESLTRERLRRGDIRDTLPEDLVARDCRVATLDDPRFPPRARAFLQAHYIPVGRLRVAGTFLAVGGGPPASIPFPIAVPAEYTVVGDAGPVAGSLDGTPFTGPRRLEAGTHEFADAGGPERLAVVWARAVRRGFTPFGAAGGAR